MRTQKFLLITIILLMFSSLLAWSQSQSADIVKTHYPQIYSSIYHRAEAQWSNDSKLKQAVIEGQAKAFLEVLDASDTKNSDLIREAIILNSLPNDKESNINILNRNSLADSFSSLQCDWYKVRTYYKKNVDSGYVPQQTMVNTNANKQIDVALDPQYKEEIVSYNQLDTEDNSFDAKEVNQQQTNVISAYQEAYNDPNDNIASTAVPASTGGGQQTTKGSQYSRRASVNNNDLPTRRSEQTNYSVGVAEETQRPQSPRRPANRTEQNPQSKAYAKYQRTRDVQNEEYFEDQKKRESHSFHVGVKIGVGPTMMYNLGNYADKINANGAKFVNNLQVKSKFGPAFEVGGVFGFRSGKLLIQNETTLQYMKVNFRNRSYSSESRYSEGDTYHNSYLYLQTAFHFGGYFDIGETTNLVVGVGPYVGYRLSSSYDDKGIFQEKGHYEKYMKDGQKDVDFGITSMIGLEMENKYRIALYPSIGLTKMQEEQDFKPFKVMLGFTYLFF